MNVNCEIHYLSPPPERHGRGKIMLDIKKIFFYTTAYVEKNKCMVMMFLKSSTKIMKFMILVSRGRGAPI